MRHPYTTLLLLPIGAALALSACEAALDESGEPLAFRDVDICVLVNEPPSSPPDEGGDPADLEILPPCSDPNGCTDPASGIFYHTYFEADGSYTNVWGDCPSYVQDPTVEATSQTQAEALCQTQYGYLCRALCDCHGGSAVLSGGQATACAEGTGGIQGQVATYRCGCTCSDVPQ